MTAILRYLIVAAAAASPGTLFAHSGRVVREGFAWSDVGLAVFAAIGIVVLRRALRQRFRKD